MNTRLVARGLAFYTAIAGFITVGCIYLLTHSGLYTIVATVVGLLLVVLGGAQSGPVSASAVEGAENAEMGLIAEDMPLRPSPGEFGIRSVLIFYGLGLVLWSVIVLTAFRTGFH